MEIYEVGFSHQIEPYHFGFFSSLELAHKILERMGVVVKTGYATTQTIWYGNYYIKKIQIFRTLEEYLKK